MERLAAVAHPANMPGHPRHFLREWRLARELTLEQAAEKIALLSAERASTDPDARPYPMTHATLSRIERGLIPYNQHLLELLSDIYQADVPSLVIRDPTNPNAIWSIYDRLTPSQRVQLEAIAETLARTGTGD